MSPFSQSFSENILYYDPTIISRPAYATMKHMLRENWGLCVKRGFDDSDAYPIFSCNQIISRRAWSRPGSIGSEYLFPLYQYTDEFDQSKRTANFNRSTLQKIEVSLGLKHSGSVSREGCFTALELFDYVYATLYSKNYVSKYREFLKIEFPRIPYPKDIDEFFRLARIGEKLRLVHCMLVSESDPLVSMDGVGTNSVDRVSWKNNCVYINSKQRFTNITSDLWNYYVGGYQPLQKWLKDRKGRILTEQDIEHYKKIVFAIKETERIISNL